MSSCGKPYSIVNISDVDIDNLASAPDYFLAERDILDPESGDTIRTPVRVPGAKVMPTGNLANVIALEPNNSALTVPEGQVRAGYIDTQPTGNIMKYADSSNRAHFLMLGDYAGKMLIQATGFLHIDSGHSYIVGAQYYLGDEGEPVTDSQTTGQKLFLPLDSNTLLVNGDF